jgi:glycosyltransferase involved in cell wall biosynthesis
MKLLWVKCDLLHPTERGGQIRTLKMLEQLHRRHEVHYLTFHDPADKVGPARAKEYCSRMFPVEWAIPHRRSARFLAQSVQNLGSSLPLVIDRYASDDMRRQFARLRREERYDSIVADFLFPSINLEPLEECVLFQHNVESMIWERYVEQAPDPLRRWYFREQAKRLWRYEQEACRRAAYVAAVSEIDAELMRRKFGLESVAAVPTGVDVDELTPPAGESLESDLVFVGSMDWMPNGDGMNWFLDAILPLIRQQRPETTVTVVGRKPSVSLVARAAAEPGLRVTGTVPDVRPFLWKSAVSIVPLRIGSGTRLKIYEAMAARVPVVSTTIGAEGLDYDPGTMKVADEPREFAARCLELLDDQDERGQQAASAWEMVRERYSWQNAARVFEEILNRARSSRVPNSKSV